MLLGDFAGLATTGVRLSTLKLDSRYSFDEGLKLPNCYTAYLY